MGGVNFKPKNLLKDLIYLGQTKPVSKQTIKGLFRFALEPILDTQTPRAVVLTRLFDTEGIDSVLQRLDFKNIETYSFDSYTKGENLEKEDIWGNTEFLVVLSPRYSVVLLWDYSTEEIKNTSCLYYLLNSRLVNDVIRIISNNSKINLMRYTQEYTPERRNNELLNSAVHKFINFADTFVEESALSNLEDSLINETDDLLKKYEYISSKTRLISHDIKNQLSVIDLYSKIIEKRISSDGNVQNQESLNNAVSNIRKAKDSVGILLNELCTIQTANLVPCDFSRILENVVSMVNPKAEEKFVELKVVNNYSGNVVVDENKLLNVFINIIYNAIDSVSENGLVQVIANAADDGYVKVQITDNGKGILTENQDKIFLEGYTTKSSGSGLGLYISKEAMKEQYGDLILLKSDSDCTIFEITIPKA